MRTVLIQVMSVEGGGYEARLALDWDGIATPGIDAPRVVFGAAPAPPPDSDWITFLLQAEGASPQLDRLGTELYDLVIAGEIAAALERARAEGAFRLLLKVDPPELDALPWELMRHDGMPMFTNSEMPIARVSPSFSRDFEAPRMCWPLRVLVVVGSADKAIQVEAEVDFIREGFRKVCGLVDLEVVKCPDRECVRKMAEAMQPDVFHFIGHGDYDEDDLRGYLLLEQENAASIEWTRGAIRDDLAGGVPRLAVLNACQSGRPDEHRGTRAAARGLTELNVPAVIAMQGPIRGEPATHMAKGFYEALSAGQPLDEAVAQARKAVTRATSDSQRDYALPALILGAPPERIINLSHCDPNQRLAARHRGILSFVDRVPGRRQLWNQLWVDSQVGPKIFAIIGPENTGKGSLVRWCLGVASVVGHPVALADLGKADDVNSVGVLQELVKALPDGDGQAAAELSSLRADLRKYQDAESPYNQDPSRLYEKLASVLASLAAEQTLVIGIDGFGVIEGMWAAHAVPGLVEPIARGAIGNVRLVVGLHPKQLDKCFPPRYFDRDEIEDIEIDLFPAKDFTELVSQRMRALGYARKNFERLVSVYDAEYKRLGAWGVDTFGDLDRQARKFQWEREP